MNYIICTFCLSVYQSFEQWAQGTALALSQVQSSTVHSASSLCCVMVILYVCTLHSAQCTALHGLGYS